jgi:hypothetical protein
MLLPDRRTIPGYPVLQVTILGWTLCGRTPTFTISNNKPHTFLIREINLDTNLTRFWEVEAKELSAMSPEQQACEQHFTTHATR